MKKSIKNIVIGILSGLVVFLILAIVGVVLVFKYANTSLFNGDGVVSEVSTQNIVVVQEELRDMGFLVTQDYLATVIYDEEHHEELLGFALAGTSNRVIISYDVDVSAGVDFEQITVDVNDEDRRITVTLPYAEIYGVPSLDPDTFQCYLDESGIFASSFNIEDHNEMTESIIDLAVERAIEMGIIDKANENAQTLVYNTVFGMVSNNPEYSRYEIVVQTSEPEREAADGIIGK